MQTRRLGSSGPEISVVGYGSWEAGGTAWGPNESEDAVIAAIHAGLDAGIDWVDTAEVYGDGASETIVGKALAGRRDAVTIATKVAPLPEGTGFRPEEVRKACEESLGRLLTDRIDLYQLHWEDETGVPLEETWGAMADLVDDGLVRFIGMSNFEQGQIERCETIRHVDSMQPEFSMLTRETRDLIGWCGEHGVGVVAYGPLGYGLLTGAIDASMKFAADDWRTTEADLFKPEQRAKALAFVDELRPIAGSAGASLAQLAIAWVLAKPGVTSAIVGSRNAGHVRSNVGAADVVLSADALALIETLLPATS
jgi:aryl-alcohol dehydrogenase-like predicted oxidoreductase